MKGAVLPMLRAYAFAKTKGIAAEAAAIRQASIPRGRTTYTTTVRRGMMVRLLKRKALLDEFIRKEWQYGSTPSGQTAMKRYVRVAQERGV